MPHDIAPSTRPGHARRGLHRAVVALLVAAVLALALPGGDALAGTPRSYSPRHVWQLKDNCVWAAGQMLVDKWTHGRVRVYQARLRRASGDKKGGSSLYDLSKGIARLTGIHLRASPGLGDSMTWWQLLDRLEHGGGAVLIGEYSRLPDHFTRWDPSFARKRSSSHAVYIERYDRANARVWLMDPLAEGAYAGEWIAVTALRRFASFKGDAVVAAATPARHNPTTAPLIDTAYVVGAPTVGRTAVAGSTLKVRVPLQIRFGFPAPSAQRFVATWEPVVDAIAARTSARSRAVVDTASMIGDQPDPVEVATTQPGRPVQPARIRQRAARPRRSGTVPPDPGPGRGCHGRHLPPLRPGRGDGHRAVRCKLVRPGTGRGDRGPVHHGQGGPVEHRDRRLADAESGPRRPSPGRAQVADAGRRGVDRPGPGRPGGDDPGRDRARRHGPPEAPAGDADHAPGRGRSRWIS